MNSTVMYSDSSLALRRFCALLKLILGGDVRRYILWNSILALVLAYVLIPPVLVGKIIDFLTQYRAGESWAPLYIYSGWLGGLAVIVALVRLQAKSTLAELAITAAYRARVYGFERLMNQSIKSHEAEGTGNKIQRVTTGSIGLEALLRSLSGDVLNVIIVVVGVLAAFFFTNPLFGIIGLTHVVFFIGIQIYFTRRVSGIIEQSKQAAENATGAYVEGAANILTIRTLNLQQGMTERVTAKEATARALKVRINALVYWKWRCFQTLQGCILGIFIYAVGRDVLIGQSSAGDLLVLFTYFRSLHENLGDSTSMIDSLIDQVLSVKRIAPILEDGCPLVVGTQPFPKNWSTMELKNINARYQNDIGGLLDFSLTIRKGEHLGIVGVSGAGKSTLAKVLMGVQPIQNGSYTISDIPYADIAPTEASNAMSMVLQDAELFNASLAENIAAMREVSEERIREAIRIAGLDSVVEKLSDGIDTLIGEKGYRLSGGERQRLGIARAICKDPDILVFDEATSALDGEIEARIHETLLAAVGEKTLIIITHRLSTIRNVDRIVVIENGSVVEEGSPADLIGDSSSRFAQMWRQ